ncbi:MAG TPA: UdgX family uracil-DNA binding protein [Candidatus Limnocylindrales bacterium]
MVTTTVLAQVPATKLPEAAERAAAAGAGFEAIRGAAGRCRACDLWARATQTVFGAGPVPAPLMLVGEQPGDHEDLQGQPFVGPAGRILSEGLEAAGIDRETAFVTNVVKHFKWKSAPGSKRRLHDRPNRVEVGACLPWVEAELELVRPAALVLLGATAAQGLLGRDVAVLRERGRPIESDLAPLVLVTVHPSSILRAGAGRAAAFRAFVRDLEVVARRMAASPAPT